VLGMSQVEIVVPAYNEEHVLAESITRLQLFLAQDFPYDAKVTVVDNASSDRTLAIAKSLGGVKVVHLDEKGRGRALRAAWSRSEALQALLPLIEDNHWFFDTELLYLAERHRMRIHEVAVEWVEDPDSRVKIVSTAIEDLRGVARLRRAGAPGFTAAEGSARA